MKRIRVVILGVTAAVLLAATAASAAPTKFKDVPSDHTFSVAINWMAENGITRGCNPPTNDMFCPDDYVTRGQMSAFLKRLADSDVMPAGAQGPKGDKGATGAQGPKGDKGGYRCGWGHRSYRSCWCHRSYWCGRGHRCSGSPG